MNQSDLQIIEDFNAQVDEVNEKVDKLIKYLKECHSIEIDQHEKEVEVQKLVLLGLDNFDLYTFVDFIEMEQANDLQNVINNFQNQYKDTQNLEFLHKVIDYNNSLETRMLYLDTILKNDNENYYKLHNNQVYLPPPEQNQQGEPMEIEYLPKKLIRSEIFSKKLNQPQN